MKPTIRLAGNTEAEEDTKSELEGLLAAKDLAPWCFTTDVVIDEASPDSHSHPVLTLNTRNRGLPLLAVYVHEQMHWFSRECGEDPLIGDELRRRYPEVPVGPPDGCRSTVSNYLHLVVCWLEIDALRLLVGPADAERYGRRQADSGHYQWVYATVLDDFDVLAALYRPRGLFISSPCSR